MGIYLYTGYGSIYCKEVVKTVYFLNTWSINWGDYKVNISKLNASVFNHCPLITHSV